MLLSFTVDIEMDLGTGNTHEGIDHGLPFILSLLKEHKIKGTFFINGLAVNHLITKGLLEQIIDNGHEIASHGNRHIDYRLLPPEKSSEELLTFKENLERITGKKVIGFRAPQFRIDYSLVRILKEIGFKYDSSLPEPGCLSAASLLRNVETSELILKNITQEINEFPISCIPIIRIPNGLLWISKIGFKFYRFLFNLTKKRDNLTVFYIHPYDVIETRQRNNVKFNSFLQKIFYSKNISNPRQLLIKLLNFWKRNNVKFIKLEDFYREASK